MIFTGGIVITGGIIEGMYLGIPIVGGNGIPGTIGGLPGYDMTLEAKIQEMLVEKKRLD